MDIDEDDDFYADENSANTPNTSKPDDATPAAAKPTASDDIEDEEEDSGSEEDESDSDLEIITERKPGTKITPPPSRYSNIRDVPQRTGGIDGPVKVAAVVKKEGTAKQANVPTGGAELPGIATSKIDVNAKPIYEPVGKPITQVDIDQDLIENDKPWRRPGTDVSDYFNYGFDEFTWALYAGKQDSLRAEFSPEKQHKMMEDMNMMMMGGMPGMMPGGGAPPGMPGMEGVPPEMQAMMQQMMQSGMDPSQMDPQAMFGGGMGGQQQAAGGGGFGGQGQNQQFGGFDQSMMNQGGQDSNRGGRGGFRGKRGRGW